ncbi:MAG: cytochrome c biogenesis protein ResB [Phycisphaeraceae bacterium]|nr:cytochrome c biogenesis protein ResB [Phycisphaeraceae bacterium]
MTLRAWPLKLLASLRLTVTLFALLMILIFVGTLAQVELGIWHTVNDYFRSPVAWIDPGVLLPAGRPLGWAVPFPGGFALGALLLVNLAAAHAVRFKLSWKRSGMILVHAGVMLLLVGELVTATTAREGQMAIDEGSWSNYVYDLRATELAISASPDDPASPTSTATTAPSGEIVIPDTQLAASAGRTIPLPDLPFAVEVQQWIADSQLIQTATAQDLHGPSSMVAAIPAQGQSTFTAQGQERLALPSAYISLKRGQESLGRYLVSAYWENSQPVQVDGKTYQIALRLERHYKPYRIHLIDFKHDKFVGTDVPRNFSSLIRLEDLQNGEDRQVLIKMNHPLRYRGETFYQAAYKPGDTGTILQVVRNPGWLLPYASCAMVGLGMAGHFGIRLAGSLRKEVR